MNSSRPAQRPQMSCWERNKKNKQQANSVSGGMMLMLVSGLHISYGIFDIDIKTMHSPTIIKSSWYVGVILAGFVAHLLINKWEKKFFYYLGAIACAVGSGMFIKSKSEANYEEFLIFGRFLAGIGHGLVYMPLVIHCGEVSVQELRGKLLSTLNFWIMMSVSIFNAITISCEDDRGAQKLLLAIFGIIYSVVAVIFILMMFYESPLFLIRKNQESEALVNMIKLRSEKTETLEIRTDFEDLKQMIQEDNQTSSNIFKDNNLRPLLLVTLSKLFYSMSLIWLLNIFRLSYSIAGSQYDSNGNPFRIALHVLFIRTILGLIPLFGMDTIGRKKLMTVSATLCGITIIILGIILKSSESRDLRTLVIFFILFDLFSSFGIIMVPDVLASEAFPLTKKSLSITFANTIDTLFTLILIIATPHVVSESLIYYLVWFGLGGLLILGAVFFYTQLTETKTMSLRESRDVLRGRSNQLVYNSEC